MISGRRATSDRARSLLIVGALCACLGHAALESRAREAPVPPRCATRIEVTSASFDQLGCAEALSALLARAGLPSRCGDATGNLAARDGDRLEVALESCELRRARMPGPQLRLLGLAIDVNRASVEDLEALPGVGPVMAARILDARPFQTLDELREVSGIGPRRFAALRQAAEVSKVSSKDFGRR
jgi:hypothetical protein